MAKVSVRIPSFNCDPRLSNAIESVLNQSFLDYDLVVVDNSVDHSLWQETKALTERYCLPAIHNPTPGLAENWNYCIKSCQGQFVLILHMDDELLPSMLEKSVAFLNATPNAGLVHSDVLDLTPGGRNLLRRTQEKPVLKAGTEALMKFMTSNNLACSSVMVRRECYDRLGYFLTGNPSPDLEMWARIGKDYDIGHLDEPLVKVTLHLISLAPGYCSPRRRRKWKYSGAACLSACSVTCRKKSGQQAGWQCTGRWQQVWSLLAIKPGAWAVGSKASVFLGWLASIHRSAPGWWRI